MKLFVDDIRIPIDTTWIIARSYNEFVKILNKEGFENFDIISLDHDLGDTSIPEKNGMDCAKYLIDFSLDFNISLPKIYVHSDNNVGSENIKSIINNWFKFNGISKKCISVSVPHTI
jgi:hypothetical protein